MKLSKEKETEHRNKHPRWILNIFERWFLNNITNPYPSQIDIEQLIEKTNLNRY